jgi:hypothetical protein
VEHSDSEFAQQQYLGLYPTLEKMEDIHGYLQLGFRVVTDGGTVRNVMLAEATKGTGLVRNRKGW